MVFAIPNHPWVDEKDGAAVRIAMTVGEKGKSEGQLLSVVDESAAPERIDFSRTNSHLSGDLRSGTSVTSSGALSANRRIAVKGVVLHGEGFILSQKDGHSIIVSDLRYKGVVKPYRNGQDIVNKSKNRFVIDFFGYNEHQCKMEFPIAYQHVRLNVKPERDSNRREIRRKNWWLFGETVPALREAVISLSRYIVTVRTAKHRTFVFLDSEILPESRLVAVGSDDAYFLGVLSSRAHVAWALAWGARLGVGDDPNYNNSECFDTFPFPADVPEPLKDRIRVEAEALDALRKRVLAEHDDLTLTRLYNVLEALKAGRALGEAERDIHDRGLVSLIRQHHDAIDALVAQAYGWADEWNRGDLSDEAILTRLVALNHERAAEEARGLIRWLRPEYQAPDYAPPVTQSLDLGEAMAALPDTVIPWPGTLPEQVSAVQGILAASAAPLAPQDVARAFKGKRAATVRPVLDALTGIGMARRLQDGRYAA